MMAHSLSRRRFLSISAAACASGLPTAGRAHVWQGRGLGGAVSVRLEGLAPGAAARVERRITQELERTERLFSLHRDSDLARLNRDGRLAYPAEDFLELCALAGQVHLATGGAFDPTVQAIWRAAQQGGDLAQAEDLTGWDRLRIERQEIRLERGMALTFNGIAQGWAADRIAALLRSEGLRNVLIDMGEIVGLGGRAPGQPWRVGIAGPIGQDLRQIGLTDRALATSSPMGTVMPDGRGHILHPRGQAPVWSTVSVSAPSAAVADALSTAFCLMPFSSIVPALQALPGARCEVLAPV